MVRVLWVVAEHESPPRGSLAFGTEISVQILATLRRDKQVKSDIAKPAELALKSNSHASSGLPLSHVRTAYEQVADQIRQLILSGIIKRNDRLPTETHLATDFGVSRATVREALRLLAAQNLVRTVKGASGGSFVTGPSISDIADYLHTSFGIMVSARDVTLEEFLEARELLEVPAARRAAERQDPTAMRHIHESIGTLGVAADTAKQSRRNRQFHSAIIEAAGNTLLLVAAQPVFSVLHTNLQRGKLGKQFQAMILEHHMEIAKAIDHNNGDRAASLMDDHLAQLRPYYERVWPHSRQNA